MPPRSEEAPEEEVMSSQETRGVKAKHVILTTLKWAAIGAVAVGLIAAALPMLGVGSIVAAGGWWSAAAAGLAAIVPGLGGVVSTAAAGVGSMALSWGMTGAMFGAIGAGAIGLFQGLSGMDARAEEARDDRMANQDRAVHRQERLLSLQRMRRQQEQNMGRMEQEYGLANLPRGGRGVPGAPGTGLS